MARLVAFLRGINLGNRRVRMEDLRRHFEAFGFDDVQTVIASGNVVFATRKAVGPALEKAIETHLAVALGFESSTFVRTFDELDAILAGHPFASDLEAKEAVVQAWLLRRPLDPSKHAPILALATENDVPAIGDRVVYLLTRERSRGSVDFMARLGKHIGAESTARNLTTIRRLATDYR